MGPVVGNQRLLGRTASPRGVFCQKLLNLWCTVAGGKDGHPIAALQGCEAVGHVQLAPPPDRDDQALFRQFKLADPLPNGRRVGVNTKMQEARAVYLAQAHYVSPVLVMGSCGDCPVIGADDISPAHHPNQPP